MLGRGMVKGLLVTIGHMIDTYRRGPKRFPKRYLSDGTMERLRPDTRGLTTVQYPFERLEMFPRFRGVLAHLRDPETGKYRCTACMACERACPHGVIAIEAEGKGKERTLTSYKYDLGRCIFCRLCVEACPFDAIEMSREYEWACTEDEKHVLELEDLLEIGDRSGIEHTGEAWR